MVRTKAETAKISGSFEGVLSENIGSSHTKRYEDSTISENKKISPHTGVVHATCSTGELAIPIISRAFAGVGRPIKLCV